MIIILLIFIDNMIITINNHKYNFNKNILINKSEYFERCRNIINISTTEYLEQIIIDNLNDKKIIITEDNLSEIIEIADYYNFYELIKSCNEYFKINILMKNNHYSLLNISEYHHFINILIEYLFDELDDTISYLWSNKLHFHDYNTTYSLYYPQDSTTYEKYKILLNIPLSYFCKFMINKYDPDKLYHLPIYWPDDLLYTTFKRTNFFLTYLGVHFYKKENDQELLKIFDQIKNKIFNKYLLSYLIKKSNFDVIPFYTELNNKTPFVKHSPEFFKDYFFNYFIK